MMCPSLNYIEKRGVLFLHDQLESTPLRMAHDPLVNYYRAPNASTNQKDIPEITVDALLHTGGFYVINEVNLHLFFGLLRAMTSV